MGTKKVTQNDEYLDVMLPRMIAGAGRRVASGDIESLASLVKLDTMLADATDVAVRGLLAEGYTMTEIARVLGVTRQYAWRKFQHLQPKDSE